MAGRILVALAVIAASIALAGCKDGGQPAARAGEAVSGRVTVFAAASLTDAFREIAAAFHDRYPGASVQFNFAGSPTLRLQLEQGARADVFASADAGQMELAAKAGLLASPPEDFAGNSLVIITPPGHPARVASSADLARPGLKLVLANKDVPAGAYARQSLARMEADPAFGPGFAARVLANVVSEESNVKQVVAKIQLGQADAGIVYASDVTPSVARDVATIPIPAGFNVNAAYPIAVLEGAANPAGARALIDFILSPAGREVLRKYGFTTA